MQVDVMGNVYRWNNNEIDKIEQGTKLTFENNFLSFGDIQNFDLTNPFKPFLFFENSQTIVVLDNTLSTQSELNLERLNLGWITQVCGSKWSGYWLWNNMTKSLIKINPIGEPIIQIPNLAQSDIQSSWEIKWMAENGNYLFMRDHEHLFVFDLFGGLNKIINVPFARTWILNNQVVQYDQQKIEIIYPNRQILVRVPNEPYFINEDGLYFSIDTLDFRSWSLFRP